MQASCSFEKQIPTYKTTCCHTPEDHYTSITQAYVVYFPSIDLIQSIRVIKMKPIQEDVKAGAVRQF
jgi:hypothetical protein